MQKNDDWDLQELYNEDPQKAFYLLSKNIFDVQILSKHIENAMTSHVSLQEAIFVLVNKARKQFWHNFILSKKGMSWIFGLIILVAVLTAIAHYSTLVEWLKNLN